MLTTQIYGWAECSIQEFSEQGPISIKVLNSAFDADGGGMIVGAVPEPTSELLLLLGIAGIALRRRKSI